MLRIDTHPVRNRLALLMLLVLISVATASLPSNGMQVMGSEMKVSHQGHSGNARAMNHGPINHGSMNHESMNHQAMVDEVMVAPADGCPPGDCCIESCGQAGIVASPMMQPVPVSSLHTLATLPRKSRPSGAVYRPPRLAV